MPPLVRVTTGRLVVGALALVLRAETALPVEPLELVTIGRPICAPVALALLAC
jgi:hypothetical protein